jgi:lysophospholipase L1-like esterase
VKISQTGNWRIKNSFKTFGHYGVSGFTTSSDRATDSITLEMTEGNSFEEVEIEFLRSPNAGTILVDVNNRYTWEIVTKGTSGIADREVLTIPGGGQWLTLSPKGDGAVELLSWNFRNHRKGILYHSHGIVGVTIHVMNQWDPSIVAWELQQLNPALILLAFGTNEGFNDRLKKEDYERSFREKVKFLQQSVPQGTSVVIIGPPDAQRLPGYCSKNVACSSLDDYEIEKYSTLLSEKNRRLCRWHSPPKLNVVREIQRRVANEQGYFFWDWSKVMGGECGTHFWATQTPSLAAGDHVHLTSAGYHFSAEALFNDLMIELSRY